MSELKPFNPSWRDWLASIMMGEGRASPERRRMVEGLLGSTGLGTTGLGLADATPLGQIFGAQEALHEGGPGSQQLAAMSIMPAAGVLQGAVKGGAKAAMKAAPSVADLEKQMAELQHVVSTMPKAAPPNLEKTIAELEESYKILLGNKWSQKDAADAIQSMPEFKLAMDNFEHPAVQKWLGAEAPPDPLAQKPWTAADDAAVAALPTKFNLPKEMSHIGQFIDQGVTLMPAEIELLKDYPAVLQAAQKKGVIPGKTYIPGAGMELTPTVPFGPAEKAAALTKMHTALGTDPVEELLAADASRRANRMLYPDEFVGPPAPQTPDLSMHLQDRLQRAAEQGFDTAQKLYTGVPTWGVEPPVAFKDPRTFGKAHEEAGFFLADRPDVANEYARQGTVFPVYAKKNNPLEVNWSDYSKGDQWYNHEGMNAIMADAVAGGHDFVTVKDIKDLAGGPNLQNQYIAMEPANIRSIFARFDPKAVGANDLTAALAAAFGLPGAAAMLMPPEAKK